MVTDDPRNLKLASLNAQLDESMKNERYYNGLKIKRKSIIIIKSISI